MPSTGIKWLAALWVLVLLTYSNHFRNSFHFDDSHTVVENPWIRDLRNIPRFFTDSQTFSTLPANRVYRPLVQTALAVDYRLGKGLNPFWFHVSNLFWFMAQLGAMFVLFRNSLERIRSGPQATWVALAAAAIYGVHPAMAETVNYVVQRGDIYSTLGVVAGLAIYATAPGLRRYGLYLIPVTLAMLAKPPAVVFPALLIAWIWLFDGLPLRSALTRSVPSLAACAAMMAFVAHMNPPSFTGGGVAGYGYRITQPAVLLGYFGKFFIPTGLTADTDRVPFASLATDEAITGLVFLAVFGAVAWGCARKAKYRPVAFGMMWFLIASVPTSAYALAEVENDHRMYFPFVGLSLSVCCAAALIVERRGLGRRTVAAVCALILALFALGARERNKVWLSEETLWKDVTIKSPRNGRGLMNYGLTLMEKGDYPGALDYFNRALPLNPNYYILETNLGIAYGASGDGANAVRHFDRAAELAPGEATPHFFYARWLSQVSKAPEAMAHLKAAIQFNPDYMAARYLLMQLDADSGDATGLRAEARETLSRFPGDATASAWLAKSLTLKAPALPAQTPESYLSQSLTMYQAKDFQECIRAAREALKLRPNYAEAWNNIAAAYNSMGDWDKGIAAAEEAVRLKPDFQLARNNLAWAVGEKRKFAGGH